MKAGDFVYDLPDLVEMAPARGELEEFLADCVISVVAAQSEESRRLSNGFVADALLAALDGLVKTKAQWKALNAFIEATREGIAEARDA